MIFKSKDFYLNENTLIKREIDNNLQKLNDLKNCFILNFIPNNFKSLISFQTVFKNNTLTATILFFENELNRDNFVQKKERNTSISSLEFFYNTEGDFYFNINVCNINTEVKSNDQQTSFFLIQLILSFAEHIKCYFNLYKSEILSLLNNSLLLDASVTKLSENNFYKNLFKFKDCIYGVQRIFPFNRLEVNELINNFFSSQNNQTKREFIDKGIKFQFTTYSFNHNGIVFKTDSFTIKNYGTSDVKYIYSSADKPFSFIENLLLNSFSFQGEFIHNLKDIKFIDNNIVFKVGTTSFPKLNNILKNEFLKNNISSF